MARWWRHRHQSKDSPFLCRLLLFLGLFVVVFVAIVASFRSWAALVSFVVQKGEKEREEGEFSWRDGGGAAQDELHGEANDLPCFSCCFCCCYCCCYCCCSQWWWRRHRSRWISIAMVDCWRRFGEECEQLRKI